MNIFKKALSKVIKGELSMDKQFDVFEKRIRLIQTFGVFNKYFNKMDPSGYLKYPLYYKKL